MTAPKAGVGEDVAVIRADVRGMVARVEDVTARLDGATIAITGAGGMIGGYVADLVAGLNDSGLLARPMRLILATRFAPAASSRLSHLVGRSDVDLRVAGAHPTRRWADDVDYVVHAASPAAPQAYLADPIGTLDANSRQLDAILDLASRSNARGVVYLSTSEVYGDPPAHAIPTPETFVGTTDPTNERASYVEAKRFGEALCMAYHRQRGLPVSIVRPFHIHGPGLRADDGRIVAALMRSALAGTAFRLASDGTATRTYGYVADAAVGILRAMLLAPGEVLNIGADGPETSIVELARVVADLAGAPEPITNPAAGSVHLPDAPARSRADIAKARALIGFEPQIALREGLARTLSWCRAREGWAA